MNSKAKAQLIRNQILTRLNDCRFHSGEELAAQFGISRSAVSNHIKALMALGIDIFSVKGRGYQLAQAIELLNKNQILSLLAEYFSPSYVINPELVNVENVLSSTNDVVKARSANSDSEDEIASGYFCVAEAQTAGRGRRGRTWVSPFGSSIYLSLLWRFSDGYQAMAGLSIMVGVALNNTLKDLGLNTCKLKWPNDVYHQNKKLAGILIEVEGQASAGACAIIGIGLNINLPDSVEGIDQEYTDLQSALQAKVSRNQLLSRLVYNLWQSLPIFEQQGLTPFLDDWTEADLYKDTSVKLLSGNSELVGLNKGIDKHGALVLEIDQELKTFHGGEISVRAL